MDEHLFMGPPDLRDLYQDSNFPEFSFTSEDMDSFNDLIIEDPSLYDFDISAIQDFFLESMEDGDTEQTDEMGPFPENQMTRPKAPIEVLLEAISSSSNNIETIDEEFLSANTTMQNNRMSDPMGPFMTEQPIGDDPFSYSSFNSTTPSNADSIIANPRYEISDPLTITRSKVGSYPDNRTIYA